MSNETALLSIAALKAAAYAAEDAKSTTRFYLAGVLVEIAADQAIYVATNGHIMFAYRSVRDAHTLRGNWIIPIATIKALKYRKRGSPDATLMRTPGPGNLMTIKTQEQSLDFTPIDGTFPDWRKVVPERTKGHTKENLEYDTKLMERLYKAGQMLVLGEPCLSPNDDGAALVTYSSDNAIGLIMPKRGPLKKPEPAPAGAH